MDSCFRLLAGITLAALSSLVAVADAAAAVYTVGPPGATTGCTHATLQAAINAAAASPGLDIIRIARGTYPAQHLFINDSGDLAIEGGFVECATLVHVDYSTLDGAGANPPGPIIDHRGAGSLTLSDLHIQNSNAMATGTTLPLGGGVSSSGAGALTIRRSILANNRAYYGGGLYLGTSAPPKAVTLSGVSFVNNGADKSGGGIYAQLSELRIEGDVPSDFAGNHADGADDFDGGGALYATESNVTVDARMPSAYPFMSDNRANAFGGAIYFRSASANLRELNMAPRRGGGTLEIADNTAAFLGGAIYADAVADNARATLVLKDAIVSGNGAPVGSAISLFTDKSGAVIRFAMRAGDTCAAAWRCNRIDHSVSDSGATVHTDLSSGAYASFEMRRGFIVDNTSLRGGAVIGGYGVGGDTLIDNSVIADNDAGNAPVFDLGRTTHVQNSTIAGNLRVSPSLFRAYGTITLYLHNNIAFQPNTPLVTVLNGAASELRNLLLSDTQPVGNEAARNIQYTQNPLFVNAAQGDYRIQAGSPARNRWSPGSGVDVPAIDLLGATRPAPGDVVTPYDFGAYEYGAVIDTIFADDFDGSGGVARFGDSARAMTSVAHIEDRP